jgi:PhnB protein
VAFYQAALGAEVVYRFETDDDVVAQLRVGDTLFWVESESPEHGNYSPETLKGSSARMLLVVDDPDTLLEEAVTYGATELSPVEDAHGWRLGRVEDPFGHRWEIGHPLGPWPPS